MMIRAILRDFFVLPAKAKPSTGLALRDYFAAQIAQSILAGGWASTIPLDDVEHATQLAAFAYQGADAMLHERNKK